MKNFRKISLIILFLIKFSLVNAQHWTKSQISKAYTVQNNPYLSQTEKGIVYYLNLCRLYPKEFLQHEVLPYYNNFMSKKCNDSKYCQSLINYLDTLTPMNVLYFDLDAYENAKCFAIEQGQAGTTGHDRINCKAGGYFECCHYSSNTSAIHILVSLLVDEDVPSLGHRYNLMNRDLTKIGLSIQPHINYGLCTVIDMLW